MAGSRVHPIASAVLALWVAGCADRETLADPTGGDTGSTTATSSPGGTGPVPASSSGTGSGESGSATSGAPSCEGFAGSITPAQAKATPRPDARAETLALEQSGALVAPDAVYDRIVRDLAALAVFEPEVADVRVRQRFNPQAIGVDIEADARADVEAGTFEGWGCHNGLYGVTEIDTTALRVAGRVFLHFRGRYGIPQLAADYGAIEGVDDAFPNPVLDVGGNDICASADGELYTYIFDAGMGPCPGCTVHAYWGFTIDARGEITRLGNFTDLERVPAWFEEAGECTQWL